MAKYLIAIVGPTAVGKTRVALRVAERYKAEIISADSRQVFRELNIGVAKPSAEELSNIRHHFIGQVSIRDDYDAARYGDEALAQVNRLFAVHDFAVLCGGSGLYVKALLEGFDPMPAVPDEVRKKILDAYEANGIEWLQGEVEAGDPDYFDVVDRKNPQRLMRALEVIRAAGMKPSALRAKNKRILPFKVIMIGLALERSELYKRIEERVDVMVANGLFEEAAQLFPERALNALQTVGYQEIFGHMEGHYDKEEAIRLLKRNTRRYAKRQMTWFRKDKEVKWFHPDEMEAIVKFIDASTGKGG